MSFNWPENKKACVCLSYDDGIRSHADYVAPFLEEHGLRGTFYAPLKSDLLKRPDVWRNLAERGHEIGNHTIFHPCRGINGDEPEWLDRRSYNMVYYTERRMREELTVANQVLCLIDGKVERTYGNTCCEIYIGPDDDKQDIRPIVEKLFLSARGAPPYRMTNPAAIDLYNMGHISADHRTAAELIAEVEDCVTKNGMLFYMIHGVGQETHPLHILKEEHRKFIGWLADQKEEVWTVPVIQAVKYIRGRK